MTKKEILRNLKYTMKKHKNDRVDTFGTNISLMCKDILDYLEKEPCDDCISRQEAINSLGECPMNWTDSDAEITAERDWKDTIEMLNSLPSVTPQSMSCEDCKYAPTTYEEYCLSRHNYSGYFCPDSYTEISHLCGNYGEEDKPQESEDRR